MNLPRRPFCDQCDRLVSTAEATACKSRFCPLRESAALIANLEALKPYALPRRERGK